MLKPIIAALVLAGVAAGSMPHTVDAAEGTRAKSRPSTETRQRATTTTRRVARPQSSGSSQPELRDRSTFYHRDGRLNGKELFDQINERGEGAM